MAYLVTSGGRTYRVDIHTDEAGVHVHLDDAAYPIDVLSVGPALYSILLDGRSYEVDCVPVEDAWIVLVDGQPFRVALQDETALPQPHTMTVTPKAAGGTVIAPMAGKIVKVHVAVGEEVAAGAPVCTLEAMKMENELTAGSAGTVEAVQVSVGDTVRAGQVLVELGDGSERPPAAPSAD
ncbi:MAG TPA: biotin/lipoyl-containing protein [Candidatus Baltobacteraceae bacterium]|nr:biotin/lipoyl-containing protein [Candidatus Baltobacteraceae bacterium]